jgi:hypothetical protein
MGDGAIGGLMLVERGHKKVFRCRGPLIVQQVKKMAIIDGIASDRHCLNCLIGLEKFARDQLDGTGWKRLLITGSVVRVRAGEPNKTKPCSDARLFFWFLTN